MTLGRENWTPYQIAVHKMGAKSSDEEWRDRWRTPKQITDRVTKFYDAFYYDPCPVKPQFDGLAVDWFPQSFINPPFSEYRRWVNYGLTQPMPQIWLSNHNHDTVWFKALSRRCAGQLQIAKRVRFIDANTGIQADNGAIGKCQTLHLLLDHRLSSTKVGTEILRFYEVFGDIGELFTRYNPLT